MAETFTRLHEPKQASPRHAVLEVRGLKTAIRTRDGQAMAVDGVTFHLDAGETLGLVGESGCGKSLTALSIMRLNPTPASWISAGQILFRGQDLLAMAERDFRRIRGKHIAMVLQDPMTALNPSLTVGEQIFESLRLHQGLTGGALAKRAIDLLELLRVPAASSRLSSYPHELSGGMRQRVVGAIALSGDPEIIIADEPTTSLDVTVQAAYLSHLRDIQRETGVSILFITHDFGVVASMCDRVAVMYAGKIIETGTTAAIFDQPGHPYTQALLRSVPDLSLHVDRLYSISGQPPSLYSRGTGCPFAPRCPIVQQRCWIEYPPGSNLGDGQVAYCWSHVS